LMPMSFFHLTDLQSGSVLSRNEQVNNVLRYFREVENKYPSDDSSYKITLRIQTKFVKDYTTDNVIGVKYTNNPDAPEVRVSEENIFKSKYPMTYSDLVDKLKSRYVDFKPDQRFHAIKKGLEDRQKHEERFCKINYLDVISKRGSQKKFYSTEILNEFDKHYTKQKSN